MCSFRYFVKSKMDDFQPVRKNKRKNKKDCGSSSDRMNQKITDIRTDICSTPFFRELKRTLLEHVEKADCKMDMVCLGLGNFMDSYIARYQLALWLALREDLEVFVDQCEIYDPQFTEAEISYLKQLHMSVPTQNKEGKCPCREGVTTIYYLPHCGKALYNNILWSNWGLQLSNVVIIGNSFSAMIERNPERLLKKTANYVIKIHPYTKERPLQVTDQYEDVFNDTSLHYFLAQSTQEVPNALWEDSSEPVYDNDDAEIILGDICTGEVT